MDGSFEHYPDNGCEVASEFLGIQSHCVECPFPECSEGNKGKLRKTWRDNDIKRHLRLGYSRKRIAQQFGLSTRTIQRVYKELINAK